VVQHELVKAGEVVRLLRVCFERPELRGHLRSRMVRYVPFLKGDADDQNESSGKMVGSWDARGYALDGRVPARELLGGQVGRSCQPIHYWGDQRSGLALPQTEQFNSNPGSRGRAVTGLDDSGNVQRVEEGFLSVAGRWSLGRRRANLSCEWEM